MECVGRIVIPVRPKDGQGYRQVVRCGQCRHCRIRKKRSWTGRLLLEKEDFQGSPAFVTLTYESAPDVLDYADFQGFMKRFRKQNGPCRFFVVGEYGAKSGRGHWHAILYTNQLASSRGLCRVDAWDAGYAYIGNVTPASVGYVAGYVLKGEKDGNGRDNITRASNRPGIGLPAVRRLAKEAARYFTRERIAEWPASYKVGGRWFPLSEGGLTAFKEAFVKEGGRPPEQDSPESVASATAEFTRGDAFFNGVQRRSKLARLELERSFAKTQRLRPSL